MPASHTTVNTIVEILIQEVGLEKAKKIAMRVYKETTGNKSYATTVSRLLLSLIDREN